MLCEECSQNLLREVTNSYFSFQINLCVILSNFSHFSLTNNFFLVLQIEELFSYLHAVYVYTQCSSAQSDIAVLLFFSHNIIICVVVVFACIRARKAF